jgi:Ankyrin repeats (3 copies)
MPFDTANAVQRWFRAVEAGADVHAKADYALQLASLDGRAESVKVLLKAGADVHVWNDSALRDASQNGHTDTVKLLKAAAAEATAASKVQEAFKNIGVELTQKQAVEVLKLVADIAAKNGPGSPARPAATAKPPAPPAP